MGKDHRRLFLFNGEIIIDMNKSVISWALYDMANTVFNLGVVGLFIPLLINRRHGTTDADLGFPIAISMAIVLILSPFLGALSDQLKGRIRTLTFLNITAAVSIFLIGLGKSLPTSLLFFSVSFVAVYLAEVVYNSLLADVSTTGNRGKIGGIAIGLGNLGSIPVVFLALQYGNFSSVDGLEFYVLGIFFIVTAFPISLFFIEQPRVLKNKSYSVIQATWLQIKQTKSHFKQNPKIIRFFLARYFYMMGVTTSSTFAVLYGIKTIGFTERQVELVLLAGIMVAIPSAVLWGYIVDKIGPLVALRWNILGWIFVLAGAVAIPWFNLTNQLWWPLSAITGLFFGGLWVSDRPLLIELSPSKLGEMFGIYGIVSRLAFLTGTSMWPLIAVFIGLGQPAAVFFLVCCCSIGLGIIFTLPSGTVRNAS
jgi:UMF1 family MFS transporter